MKTNGRYKCGSNSQVYNIYRPLALQQHRTPHFRKYDTFGLQSLLRRKAWLENILFTKRIKEYSSRKAAVLFVDYQKLKEALKRKEEVLA